MKHGKVAVVDGANVAYAERSKHGDPKVSNLIALQRVLEEQGYAVITIVDASLRHKIDDPVQLEALIDGQRVRQAPAGTDADFFVIKTAEQQDGVIISNDQYEPFLAEHPWVDERRIPFMIVEGQVSLYEEPPA